MEATSCAALRDAEAAASERMHELTARLASLEAENRGLKDRLADARERSPPPERRQQLVRSRPGEADGCQARAVSQQHTVALTDLRRRNMELQRALVHKHVSEVRRMLEMYIPPRRCSLDRQPYPGGYNVDRR